jgi:ABC-type sugar transport system ATPase subunit
VAQSDDAFVEFDHVQKSYDGENLVVKDLNLSMPKGEFLTMLGPSGSGKTTCLMMLAGFETATYGDIRLDGKPINDIPPHKRGIGMVFQNYALFPHMTVAENLAFPLQVRKMTKDVQKEKVMRALDMVQMGSFAGRRPSQLSGGQQQRIALARALVFEPELVLMDEPLGALDKQLRETLQFEITNLAHELGITVVYVTHDQTEALTMGDRIAVLKDGILQQVGSPRDLYETPNNIFVAGFIGSPAMNLFPADVTDGGVKFGTAVAPVARDVLASTSETSVTVGVRPEDMIVSTSGEGLLVEVELVEELGADGYLYGKTEVQGQRVDVVARVDGRMHPNSGDRVYITPEPKHVHVFDTTSGLRLNREPVSS